MKKFDLQKEVWMILLIILPMLYLGYIWNTLPEKIPMHFDIEGEPDRWGSKSELLWLTLGMNIGVYLLMLVVPFIDPKKNFSKMKDMFYKIKFYVIALVSIITVFIIYSTKTGSIHPNLILCFIAFMLAVMGNYFQSIKPNYFIGIRTPWTLESENVWRKTHRLTGRIWVPGGSLVAILVLILSPKIGYIVFLAAILIMVFIPLVYSYILYKNGKHAIKE